MYIDYYTNDNDDIVYYWRRLPSCVVIPWRRDVADGIW